MRRLILITAWAAVAFIAYATLAPLPARPRLADDPSAERFLAYAVAAALLTLAYPRRAVRIALLTVAMAVGLEIMQRFAIDRHPGVLDMIVKASGAVAGVCAAWLGIRMLESSKSDA